MSLRWKSPAPKKRRNKDIETALKMLIYPPAIAVGLLALSKKKRKGRNKK